MFRHFVLISVFLFTSLTFAQYSQERISLGILKGRGAEFHGTTPSGFHYQLEFLANDNGDLILDAFVSTPQNQAVVDYTQRLTMNLKETNARFPKMTTPPEQYKNYFSTEKYLYFPMAESQNLVFIELDNKGQMRMTFQYQAHKNYDYRSGFTEKDLSQKPNPQAGRLVITTEWIEVPR